MCPSKRKPYNLDQDNAVLGTIMPLSKTDNRIPKTHSPRSGSIGPKPVPNGSNRSYEMVPLSPDYNQLDSPWLMDPPGRGWTGKSWTLFFQVMGLCCWCSRWSVARKTITRPDFADIRGFSPIYWLIKANRFLPVNRTRVFGTECASPVAFERRYASTNSQISLGRSCMIIYVLLGGGKLLQICTSSKCRNTINTIFG